jgi:hypothetical protein
MTLALALAACGTSGPSTPPPPPQADPVGSFNCSLSIEGTQIGALLMIEAVDGGFTGTIDSDMGTAPVSAIVVDGMAMTFTVDTPEFFVRFQVTFEGDTFSGNFDAGAMGAGTITGTRR